MTRSSRVVETSGSLGEELEFFHKTCGSVDKVTKRAFRGKKRRKEGKTETDMYIYCRETEKGLWREHGRP